MSEQKDHSDSFSEKSFWKKINRHAGKIGCPLLCKALSMYYAFRDPNTPTWAKTAIVGALGYLISFIDAIPDIIPVVGYTDDLGVIAAAMGVIAFYVKPEHKASAQKTIERIRIKNCRCSDALPATTDTPTDVPASNDSPT